MNQEPTSPASDETPCVLACEDCEAVFDATAAVHDHPYLPGKTYLACPSCGSSHLDAANQPDFTLDDLEWAEKHPELCVD